MIGLFSSIKRHWAPRRLDYSGVHVECVDAHAAQNIQYKIPCLGDRTGDLRKVTFALTIFPLLGLLYWIPTEDRKRYGMQIVIGTAIGLLPHLLLLYWTNLVDIPVRSHDFWTLQWERILSALSGSNTSVREQKLECMGFGYSTHYNLFSQAYGVKSIHWHGWGKIMVYLGAFIAGWQQRSNIQWRQLTWVLSSVVILLTWIAKDLHHLAIATPLLGLWLVYTFDQVFLESTTTACDWRTVVRKPNVDAD